MEIFCRSLYYNNFLSIFFKEGEFFACYYFNEWSRRIMGLGSPGRFGIERAGTFNIIVALALSILVKP